MNLSKTSALLVWVIASIFYAYQYVLRVMPSIMFDDILQKFGIDAAVFGQFSGVYYIGYALMHMPLGILLDRYGPKKVMSICILITIAGLLPLIYSDNWMHAVIGRFFVGVGSSAAILGTFKVIRMAFSERQFTTMLSLSVTIGLIGAIYGGGPVGYIVEIFGYVVVTKIFIIVGLILAILTYLAVPNIEPTKSEGVLANMGSVFTNFKVIIICISSGLMVGPLEGFADVWGTQFLKISYGFDHVTAGYLPSLIFLGMCFGTPIVGILAEKTKMYYRLIIIFGIVMASLFIIMLLNLMNITFMSISFVLIGLCCGYQVLAIYKASTYVEEHLTGLTTAVANMIIMVFGYAFHTSIGTIIDIFGGCKSEEAFILGISSVPFGLFLGVLGFMLVVFLDSKKIKV